ncbi:MAG: hypothetical protein ND807_03545 [Vicinamibacterales bacterium]|nr:hypothetical protein [Vicinamibacterales bacterium]
MSASLSVPEPQSEFRVEKVRTAATLTLSNGAAVSGYFFVAGNSATHAGPERIKDVLNAEQGFFPFEATGVGGSQTVLFNREHVVVATLQGNEEAQSDPGYACATRRSVSMLLSTGSRLRGTVTVHRPQGRDRLSDFARWAERFIYLEDGLVTYIVNVRHVLELLEEIAQP